MTRDNANSDCGQGAEQQRIAQSIVDRFAKLGYSIELEQIAIGDVVTKYTFSSHSEKLRLNHVEIFADDIAVCADTQQGIMFYKPSNGENVFSVEIENKRRTRLILSSLLETADFREAKGALNFAVGRDVEGHAVIADLAKLPHLLIAGASGSGKSIFVNSMLVSLMTKYSPEHLRLLLVDPEGYEMSCYNGSPYLLKDDVISTVPDALAALDYLAGEMENRYMLFIQNGVRSIAEYNEKAEAESLPKLPYLVYVVDELSRIMLTDKASFEKKFIRLVQKSRASGIHTVLTAQRASSDVLSGTIMANIPARIAFKTCAQCDSRAILGEKGAEQLIGQGDMLFLDWGRSSQATRVQGAYISLDELKAFLQNTANRK